MASTSRPALSREWTYLEIAEDQAQVELKTLRLQGKQLYIETQRDRSFLSGVIGLNPDLRSKIDTWHDAACRWLERRFSTGELATTFGHKGEIGGPESVISETVQLKRSLQNRLHYLDQLDRDLQLYVRAEPRPEPPQPPVAAPRSITLKIEHLGQLNLDTNTVNNIQSRISGIASQGNLELAEALARFTNGLEDDEVTPGQRVEVVELVEGLAGEAAAAPNKRSLSRVRAFARAVPSALQGASKALTLWSQVDQILRDNHWIS